MNANWEDTYKLPDFKPPTELDHLFEGPGLFCTHQADARIGQFTVKLKVRCGYLSRHHPKVQDQNGTIETEDVPLPGQK